MKALEILVICNWSPELHQKKTAMIIGCKSDDGVETRHCGSCLGRSKICITDKKYQESHTLCDTCAKNH